MFPKASPFLHKHTENFLSQPPLGHGWDHEHQDGGGSDAQHSQTWPLMHVTPLTPFSAPHVHSWVIEPPVELLLHYLAKSYPGQLLKEL